MGFLKDFKDFAMRGNVIDMAVGIIIGAAFGKIVTSVVSDVIMPPIGMLLGQVDFSNLAVTLKEATTDAATGKEIVAVTVNYGKFINTVIDFTIVAFAIFLMIRPLSKLKKAPPPPPPSTKECGFCFTAIPLKATRCPNCTSQIPA